MVYGMNMLIHQPAVQPAVCPVEPGVMQIVQRHNSRQDVCNLRSMPGTSVTVAQPTALPLCFRFCRPQYLSLQSPE